MKSISINCLIIALVFAFNPASAQEAGSSEDRGFNLQGALDLLKKSTSPENFEELLNKPDNSVNNLDLNNDGEVDYVRVIDHKENDVHTLLLQVPVNEKENKDVAIIEIEKIGPENAKLQIKGNEKVFGKDIIAEPLDEKGTSNAFVIDNDVVAHGPYVPVDEYAISGIVVNVWFWPSVRFMFSPRYVVWISPYRWGRWPGWYRPWKPRAHFVYHRYHRGYYRDRARVHYYKGDGARRRRR